MATKTRHPESDLQQACIAWCRYNERTYPGLALIHSIPNGASLHGTKAQRARQWARLAREGAKPGVLDLFLPVPRGPYYGLYAEAKHGRNTLTTDQRTFADAVAKLGYGVFVFYTLDAFITGVAEYYSGRLPSWNAK